MRRNPWSAHTRWACLACVLLTATPALARGPEGYLGVIALLIGLPLLLGLGALVYGIYAASLPLIVIGGLVVSSPFIYVGIDSLASRASREEADARYEACVRATRGAAQRKLRRNGVTGVRKDAIEVTSITEDFWSVTLKDGDEERLVYYASTIYRNGRCKVVELKTRDEGRIGGGVPTAASGFHEAATNERIAVVTRRAASPELPSGR